MASAAAKRFTPKMATNNAMLPPQWTKRAFFDAARKSSRLAQPQHRLQRRSISAPHRLLGASTLTLPIERPGVVASWADSAIVLSGPPSRMRMIGISKSGRVEWLAPPGTDTMMMSN